MTLITVLSSIASAMKYTPEAYAALKAVYSVLSEQTGETITDEQWDSIVVLLKEPAAYFSDIDPTTGEIIG